MKRLCAAIAAILATLAAVSMASGVTVRWELPTLNVDGSTIPTTGPGSLAATVLEYGICTATGAVPANQTVKRVEGVLTTAELTGLIPGTEYCVRAQSENTYGQLSDYSNTVKKQAPYPVPRAPVIQ